MLSATTDHILNAPLQRPSGALAAYGSVIRTTESPRSIEYHILARTTSMLENASSINPSPAAMPSAIHENRMVWTAFAADLADDGNRCGTALRGGLLSIAMWVFAESDRVLRHQKSPAALIDVNRAVMQGLQPATSQPDSMPCP